MVFKSLRRKNTGLSSAGSKQSMVGRCIEPNNYGNPMRDSRMDVNANAWDDQDRREDFARSSNDLVETSNDRNMAFNGNIGIPSNYVVVKVEASSISQRDWSNPPNLPRSMLPFIPGYEFVGTIKSLGDTVRSEGQFREGDHIAGVSAFGGGHSRFITISASRITKIPDKVDPRHAVCLINDYMAGLNALRQAKEGCSLSYLTGANILITDGFTPIGQAVIRLASLEGANVYCCANESKHRYLASLGARCFPVNPRSWLSTSAGTFDIVIDNSCIDAYSSSRAALNANGSLVCLAPVYKTDGDETNIGCGIYLMADVSQMLAEAKAKYMLTRTSFLNTEEIFQQNTARYKQDLRYLMFLLERGWIKPKVANQVPLKGVMDSLYVVQSGTANGTMVCVPWKEDKPQIQGY